MRSYVVEHAPREASVLDLMCGPGYLLGAIAQQRPDLKLRGVDISEDFIEHAKTQCLGTFEVHDARTWNTKEQFDVVLCTAGIHHLPYGQQSAFIERLPRLLKPTGFCIVADPLLPDYSNELERKQSAAKLGYEYLQATLATDPPAEIVTAALDILYDDVQGDEWKTSLEKLLPSYKPHFNK
ncbi:methyltransferase domain-containing protein [Candidatus Woesearchaeota archaeon]|nr:methyltransferase domain-containing protein [Candidatus Woesearchaeota archaeon]